ncbi:STAS domain-containing protein [Spirochaeta cellobiosiphila]|uniref:STAS domain-containing protein n=1 Tax=Spirochaeta cellobiosiphila TaxID=504483 RepID=UPI00041B4B63|nr:STAS domain-containing protein [Spirochaeta cellobiosiphila]
MITKNEENTYTFEGDFTVENIVDLYEEITALDIKEEDFVIDLTSVNRFDTTFFQLLISLNKTLEEHDNKVLISGTLSEDIRDAITVLGLGVDLPGEMERFPLFEILKE